MKVSRARAAHRKDVAVRVYRHAISFRSGRNHRREPRCAGGNVNNEPTDPARINNSAARRITVAGSPVYAFRISGVLREKSHLRINLAGNGVRAVVWRSGSDCTVRDFRVGIAADRNIGSSARGGGGDRRSADECREVRITAVGGGPRLRA